MYLLAGTGLGGGIVVDGKIFPGTHGSADKLGYLPCCSAGDKLARAVVTKEAQRLGAW